MLYTSHDASMDVPSRLQLLKCLTRKLLGHPARCQSPQVFPSALSFFMGGTCSGWCIDEQPLHLIVH